MKKIIVSNTKNCLPLLLILLLATTTLGQEQTYAEIYPGIPFDMWKSNAASNTKTTVWYGTYTKAEGDEDGVMWSTPIQESYQYQRYEYFEGKMQLVTTYLPNGDKETTEEYFYRKGLLSATEILTYDTLQNSKQAGGWIYLYYNDGRPFQRVRTFGFPNKGVRLLDEFVFDEQQRVVKHKTTAAGKGPDMDSLLNGMKDRETRKIIKRYSDTTLLTQQFKSLYELQEEAKTTYNTANQPVQTIVTNTAGEIIVGIDYAYENGPLCTKKTYWTVDNTESEQKVSANYKIEYFTYDNGLISTHIIEEEGVQTVLEYTHFSEE